MKNYNNTQTIQPILNQGQEEEFDALTRLGRAIIAQAFIDLFRKYTRTEDILAQKQAKEWLSKPSNDLKYICSIAKMSQGEVMKKAEKMINLQYFS